MSFQSTRLSVGVKGGPGLPGGRLVIHGEDLQPGLFGATEYEYAVAVPASDVPALISALGVQTADDVMEYLAFSLTVRSTRQLLTLS